MLAPLVLSGCLGGDEDTQKQKKNAEGQKQEQQKKQSFKGTIKTLLEKGEPLKCNFSHSGEKSRMSGTAYVDGEKVRQDVSIDQEGEQMNTHVIVKNKQVYTWTSMQPGQGIKMDLSELEAKQKQNQKTEKKSESKTPQGVSESFEYNCSAWSGEDSKFTLPGGVEFMDLGGMMNQMQDAQQDLPENLPSSPEEAEELKQQGSEAINQNDTEKMKQQACEACSMAPNPEECRANLGCE